MLEKKYTPINAAPCQYNAMLIATFRPWPNNNSIDIGGLSIFMFKVYRHDVSCLSSRRLPDDLALSTA